MQFGILGLPKSGKTTLFNILTGAGAATDKYATGKREAHIGVAHVPDPRLGKLADLHQPKKITPVSVEYVDFPGLEKGEFGGLDLTQIRDMDGLVHVARGFEDEDILHADGSVDAARDIETIGLELILADLAAGLAGDVGIWYNVAWECVSSPYQARLSFAVCSPDAQRWPKATRTYWPNSPRSQRRNWPEASQTDSDPWPPAWPPAWVRAVRAMVRAINH